jgi:hypothetical protein
MEYHTHPSSFKDSYAFVFTDEENIVYRQLNKSYQIHYEHLMSSGLYNKLVDEKLLIIHSEIDDIKFDIPTHYKTIQPQHIPFISYPYEWCFNQLKDAALLTLTILKESLHHDMILKDATPFNIQFLDGKSVFIDTSSFEKYVEGKPWIAYKQFCENFLSPLLLMIYTSASLNKLLIAFPEGIPLSIISKLLPFKSRFNLWVLLHIHLQASFKNVKADIKNDAKKMSKQRLLGLIQNLYSLIDSLSLKNENSVWSNYYENDILSDEYLRNKDLIISNVLAKISVKSAVDFGTNTGRYAQLLSSKNIPVVATDFDAKCINNLYCEIKKDQTKNILPLVIDLANPIPAIGFANNERNSFLNRCHPDLVLALALIHHLAIGKNIPLHKIAEQFSSIGNYLIIEFIPKSDEKVKLLLQNREDIFSSYTLENFEHTFSKFYSIIEKQNVNSTNRIIYLMQKK